MEHALKEVARRLESGEILHSTANVIVGVPVADVVEPVMFSMDIWRAKTDCGTAMCIGGMCEWVLGRPLTIPEREHGLSLFYPTGRYIADYASIKPDQAVKAIRRFLAGEYPW